LDSLQFLKGSFGKLASLNKFSACVYVPTHLHHFLTVSQHSLPPTACCQSSLILP